MTAKDQLFVALDLDSPNEARVLAGRLREHVGGFKLGSKLFTRDGPALVRDIGIKFLDLKTHDTPNTVGGAVFAAGMLGVKMMTVHTLGGRKMLLSARRALDEVEAEQNFRPKLLGVTVLTSLSEGSLREIGFDPRRTLADHVASLAELAYDCGLDGVVCSAGEIRIVRQKVSDGQFLIVTPGIRARGAEYDDQHRTYSAYEAIGLGADFLVVGRPIHASPDPVAAAQKLVAEIEASLNAKRSL